MGNNIESDFQAAIDARKINGAHICASSSKGDFQYQNLIGNRVLLSGDKKPLQLDDVLYLASATKLLATIAALKCIEDNLFSLTSDLSAFVPELNKLQVLKGYADDGETPLFEPQKQAITMEMLLTHSSGLTYPFSEPKVKKWYDKQFPKPEGQPQPVQEYFGQPLGFQPGTDWMYGPGCDWAGLVVERATGQSLGDYLQDNIFNSLGIKDAQFFPVTREDLQSRMVDRNPGDPEGLGRAVAGGADASFNKTSKGHFGGQGLFMTPGDYMKVLKSLLVNDGKILKPATVDNMFQQHLSDEASKGHEKALRSPMGIFFRVGVREGSNAGYGLGGLLTMEDTKGHYGNNTLTWGGGFTIAWFIDRQNDLCGFVAVHFPLPVPDVDIAGTLKQVFREDICRKHAAHKQKQV